MAASWRSSNLQSFLDSVTPAVLPRYMSKSYFLDSNTLRHPTAGNDIFEYFTLGDLWNCYSEWSAYGAGTPLRLHDGKTIMQYYAPSLSAIQIYTRRTLVSFRNGVQEMEDEYSIDNSESQNPLRWWSGTSEDPDGSLLANEHLKNLYFQYYESCSPYARMPVLDKVHELSQSYPGLTSFKSIELSPASWMSIAWYPICHIPSVKKVDELNASFLTYHSIRSFQDTISDSMERDVGREVAVAKRNCIPFVPFGLATYKMKGGLWIKPEAGDHEKLTYLVNAADSWLKQLKVQHHDYNFFSSRSKYAASIIC